jgi:AAA15 family ATPase/GTPase
VFKWFRFKNFQSYLDDCIVDLSVNKKVAHSYFDYELPDGSKISKILGVFGANGSGKSNLIQPLAFISWFLGHSFQSLAEKDKIPYSPHFCTKDQNTEIEFEIAFVLPKQNELPHDCLELKYFVEFNKSRVIREEMKVKTSRLFSNVFTRLYDPEKDRYIIKKNAKYLPTPNATLEQAPHNCSLVSYLSRINHDNKTDSFDLLSGISLLFEVNESNLNMLGRDNHFYNLGYATQLFAENKAIFNNVKTLLKKYDLGLDDIEIEETTVISSDGEEESKLMPFCIHHNKGKPFRLPMHLESSGTQSAYRMLASIALRLELGGISILDEFDNDLHPQLTAEIINLFKDQSTNPKNAQLIFTSHSPEILKLLRKQHVYLTEKIDCESQAWRADEIEGLKERDNLYAKYISGALGGVPSFD